MTDNFLKLMKYISHRFKNLYEYKTLKKNSKITTRHTNNIPENEG